MKIPADMYLIVFREAVDHGPAILTTKTARLRVLFMYFVGGN